MKGVTIVAVVAKHLSANMRFKNAVDEPFQSLTRVRPNIDPMQVTFLQEGISTISNQSAFSATLTISEELVKEDE